VNLEEFNAQHQPGLTWPASFVVARAYLDQLARNRAIAPARAAAVRQAMQRVEQLAPGRERTAELDRLDALTKELDKDAGPAAPRDAARLQTLAATIRVRTAELRNESASSGRGPSSRRIPTPGR
jgi:hypothetical protein